MPNFTKKNLSDEEIKTIVNKKWYIQGFNGCLNYTFAAARSGLVGLWNNIGYGYSEFLCIYRGDYLEYIYLEDDFNPIGERFLDEHKKDKNYLKDIIEKQDAINMNSEETLKLVLNTDYKKIGKNEIIDLYQKMQSAYHDTLDVSHVIEGVSFVVEPLLKSKLEKALSLDRHDKQFRKIFGDLMQPAKPSFANEELVDLLEIMKMVEDNNELSYFKESKSKDIFSKLSHNIQDRLKDHQQKFLYNQLNYYHGEPLTPEDYAQEMAKLFEENIDIKSRIAEEQDRYKINNAKRKETFKKYNLSQDIIDLVDISILSLHWQDDRKKNILTRVYYLNLVLKKIGGKFGIMLEYLKRYLPEEITLENLDNFDPNDAEMRMKEYVVHSWRENDEIKIEIFAGKEGDDFLKVFHNTLLDKNDIHGTCASAGKTSGVARICRTKEDLAKFKEGEILITSMTRPEFVPAMKKSAAIVTDEGGITCHAAIISRELKKPCITGTKIATKALKDGDLLDVNASHGIVKKAKDNNI